MLVNTLILVALLVLKKKGDAVANVIILFYSLCILMYALSYFVYISEEHWSLICVFVDLLILYACFLCYYNNKDKLLIMYALLVLVLYLAPDMYQYYMGEINRYGMITMAMSVIDILIVGRSYVVRRGS